MGLGESLCILHEIKRSRVRTHEVHHARHLPLFTIEKDVVMCVHFVPAGPIMLVMATRSGEMEKQMEVQLNYMYSQIIFVLTYSQLKRIFEQQINYDLRRMLTGTEKFLDNLLELMDVQWVPVDDLCGIVSCAPCVGLHCFLQFRVELHC